MSRVVVLCGVDGCGKTTLGRFLAERLDRAGIENQVLWSRFRNYLSKPLLALTRMSGHNRRFRADGEWLAHHDFSRLPVYRELFALVQAIDVNIGAYLHISRLQSRCRGISICERGPWDTLVDVVADTGLDGMLGSFWSRLYTCQVADAALFVLVRRDLEAIFTARPALRHDPTIARRAAIYQTIAEREGWVVLDNNGPLAASKNILWNELVKTGLVDGVGSHVAR